MENQNITVNNQDLIYVALAFDQIETQCELINQILNNISSVGERSDVDLKYRPRIQSANAIDMLGAFARSQYEKVKEMIKQGGGRTLNVLDCRTNVAKLFA